MSPADMVKPRAYCNLCERSFADIDALQQHNREAVNTHREILAKQEAQKQK